MRTIDADALLTDRKKSKYYHLPNGDIAIPIIDIEHAPTIEPERRWIPVSERLPDTSGSYLISGVWGSGKVAVGDCNYQVEDGYFDTAWNFDVKAWMPLPEPYRGEGENEPSCHTCEHLIGQPFKPECSLSGSFVDWGRWKGKAPTNCPLRQICAQHGKEGG